MDKYLDNAVNIALANFWDSIATSFPDITNGDIAPGDTNHFDDIAKTNVQRWVTNNAK